jgi:hypothetical protein
MGVTYHPIAFLKLSGWDNIFTGAFFIAAADGDYFSGIFHIVLLEISEMLISVNFSPIRYN